MKIRFKLLHYIVLIVTLLAFAIVSTSCGGKNTDAQSQPPITSDTNVPDNSTDDINTNPDETQNPSNDSSEDDSEDDTDQNETQNPSDNNNDTNNPDSPSAPSVEKNVFEGDWHGWVYDMMDGLYEYKIVINSDGSLESDSYFTYTNLMDNKTVPETISTEINDNKLTVSFGSESYEFVLSSDGDRLTAQNVILDTIPFALELTLTTESLITLDELTANLAGAFEYSDENVSYIFEYIDDYGILTVDSENGESVYDILFINNSYLVFTDDIEMPANILKFSFEADKLIFGDIELIKV